MKVESIHLPVVIVGYEIHRPGAAIDHWRTQNADHREYIAPTRRSRVLVEAGDGGSVAAVPKDGTIARVNCVNAVIFGGNVDHVMNSVPRDLLLHYHKGFSVNFAIERNRLQPTK